MNTPEEPLTEPVIDELLSADLDGELAAAAADLGLTIEQARAAIATPTAVARRATLAAASGVVSTPVPLDADVAARLVTTSITRGRQDDDLGAARRRRERRADTARRVLVAAGSAAAVIAVIVGIGNMSSNSSSDKASTAAPTEGSPSYEGGAATGSLAFGDVSSADVLRRRVEARLRALPSAPNYATSGTTSPLREANGETTPQAQPPDGYSSTDSSSGQRSKAACAPAARAAAGGSAPVLAGSAVSDGRPVSVYVFRRDRGYDVVVVGRDCSVVTRTSLP